MRSSYIFSGQKSDVQKYFKKTVDAPRFANKNPFSQNEWGYFNPVGCKLRRRNSAPQATVISADRLLPGVAKISNVARMEQPFLVKGSDIFDNGLGSGWCRVAVCANGAAFRANAAKEKPNKNQNMKKIISAIGIGCLILVSTAVTIRADNAGSKVEDTPSYKHFTETGSFFTEKKMSTWQEFPDVSTTNAFKRAYACIAKNGYTIVSSDKEMGVISATKNVTSRAAKTVPLSILVEDSGHGGSKVTITLSLSGGLVSSGVRGFFAKVMDEIGKNPEAP